MKRRDFINKCNQCAAVSLIGLTLGNNELMAQDKRINKSLDAFDMVNDQVINLLKFVDAEMSGDEIKKIFGKLGKECFYQRNLENWIKSFHPDTDEYFNRVNRGESSAWEKLEYDKEKNQITLVGRKSDACVCSFAQCENPPLSLCNVCCKSFQEEIFSVLLKKKVNVRIDKSVLLGGDRCNTTIFIEES